ncbi:1-deoxyxylulose-5-phosphate synthase YajO isoform X2 [Aplysia californica]|nr:1-deoxyxylulose-5-phosphate synthase YajO isoform X2 [Aplysia californica]XP_005112670.1 1-deoxyxylulose-5-phosphate synthase YajO isoform X2 [Aplysia californica]
MSAVPAEKRVVYPFLGRSGIRVSNLCLGTMTFGDSHLGLPGQCTEADAFQIMDRFSQWGGNFIDTANIYGKGNSEMIVGKWLSKQPRDKYVLATKVFFDMGCENNVNNRGLSRRHMTDSLERSLERLRTNYIDLYQPHMWDDGTPPEEILRTLDDLVRCGKIRYAGMNNVSGWQMQKLVDTSKALGLNPLMSLQQQYNLACRESEYEAFQVCKTEGIAVLPWSPLKGGLFSGKITRHSRPTEGRLGWVAEREDKRHSQVAPAYSYLDDTIFNTLDVVERIAHRHGRSMPQVALRWLLQKDVVTSVIIGARTLQQLDDNMGAASGWTLSREEMQQLDATSQRPVPYPYEMLFRLNKERFNKSVMDYHVQSQG